MTDYGSYTQETLNTRERLQEGIKTFFEYISGVLMVIWLDNMYMVVKKIKEYVEHHLTRAFCEADTGK